jgi:hypothetical protein
MPRCQDLPSEFFGTPSLGDVVISVSHGWPYQAHPDPFGVKLKAVCGLLSASNIDHSASDNDVLVFFDWLSIPQRPFRTGQADRTPEQKATFENAVKEMHHMYFYADHIIHLAFEGADESLEEAVYQVVNRELEGAVFAQVGDQVQIVHPGTREQGTHELDELVQPLMYDRVLEIDNETVCSVSQAENLINDPTGPIRCVKLRRQRYGRSNHTPADDRGWIFLERFITMVKCAMLDASSAKAVVISNSQKVMDQILKGADEMRRAAAADDGGVELEQALGLWKEQLHTKTFSATSADRYAALKSAPPDQQLVAGIMDDFVLFLGKRWQAEANKQRSRARKLKRMLDEYLLTWDRFTLGYISRLEAASTRNPLSALLLLCLPPLITSVVVLYPLETPDAYGGLKSHLHFFCFVFPVGAASCGYIFPRFLAAASSLQLTRAVELKLAVWTTLFAVTCVCTEVLICIYEVFGSVTFPLPFIHLHADVVALPFLGLLWFVVPAQQRTDPLFRRRLAFAVLTIFVILLTFAIGFPCLNTVMVKASHNTAPIVVCIYLMAKLLFEWFCGKMSKCIGADIMPVVIFLASYAYEMNLCMILSADVRWSALVQMVGLDVLENCYHVYIFLRAETNVDEQVSSTSAIAVRRLGNVEVTCDQGCVRKGKNYYLLAACLIRELVEMMVPVQYLTLLISTYMVQPRLNSLVCGMTPEDLNRTIVYILADIVVELLVSIAMYIVLRRNGVQPFRLLRGFIATNFPVFLAAAVCWNMYYFCLEHSHFGADLSLNFTWLRSEDAHWECGLRWTHGR